MCAHKWRGLVCLVGTGLHPISRRYLQCFLFRPHAPKKRVFLNPWLLHNLYPSTPATWRRLKLTWAPECPTTLRQRAQIAFHVEKQKPWDVSGRAIFCLGGAEQNVSIHDGRRVFRRRG